MSGKSGVRDFEWLLEERLSPDDLAWDHAMEISATVYKRMKALGLKNKDLADKMGVTPARIPRILSGEQSMTLKTLARLESALDMDLSAGFSRPTLASESVTGCQIIKFENICTSERRAIPLVPDVIDVKEG